MNSAMRTNARLYYKILQAQYAVSTHAHEIITNICNKKFNAADIEPAKITELKKYIKLATERAQAVQLYLDRLEATIYVENQNEYRDIIKDLQQELGLCVDECKSIHTITAPYNNLPSELKMLCVTLQETLAKHKASYHETLRQIEGSCL